MPYAVRPPCPKPARLHVSKLDNEKASARQRDRDSAVSVSSDGHRFPPKAGLTVRHLFARRRRYSLNRSPEEATHDPGTANRADVIGSARTMLHAVPKSWRAIPRRNDLTHAPYPRRRALQCLRARVGAAAHGRRAPTSLTHLPPRPHLAAVVVLLQDAGKMPSISPMCVTAPVRSSLCSAPTLAPGASLHTVRWRYASRSSGGAMCRPSASLLWRVESKLVGRK
jgi:hypothetical protein